MSAYELPPMVERFGEAYELPMIAGRAPPTSPAFAGARRPKVRWPTSVYDIEFDTPSNYRAFRSMARQYPETYGEPESDRGGWILPPVEKMTRFLEAIHAFGGRIVYEKP